MLEHSTLSRVTKRYQDRVPMSMHLWLLLLPASVSLLGINVVKLVMVVPHINTVCRMQKSSPWVKVKVTAGP